MTPLIQALAEDQDEIGWINFMEGKISKHFFRIQQTFLAGSNSRINGRDWVTRFIREILTISHTQWLFRNITLHDKKQGYLIATRREKLIEEIEILHDTPTEAIPPESQFLLDCDIEELRRADSSHQEHWLAAIKAARRAGLRLRRLNLRHHQQAQRIKRQHRLLPRRGLSSSQLPRPRPVSSQQPVSYMIFGDMIEPPARRRPSEAAIEVELASNRRRKRRRRNDD
jgi:hypothetical protein